MDREACSAGVSNTQDRLKELASLARLVAFAQQNAKELDAGFSAHCLDLALDALMQELQGLVVLAGREPTLDIRSGLLH